MAVDHEALAGRNHRSYVGPERQYDLLGASQFRLLCALGLRSHHRVLDFGCGSLRAGRLLIPYLDRSRYFGIDPNRWLIDTGIDQELGRDMVELKRPAFDTNAEFRIDVFDQRFDFVLAQSIFSHTGRDLLARALAGFSKQLAPRGLIAATFLIGSDIDASGWIYPKCSTYSPKTINALARHCGLQAMPVPWFHPRQSWWLFARDISRLPTAGQATMLTGVVLDCDDFRASWSDSAALAKGVSRWYKYRLLSPLRKLLARWRGREHRGV